MNLLKNNGWSMYEVAILLFIIEHLMFGVNTLIEIFIDDVPKYVREELNARKYSEKQAEQDMETFKNNRGLQSIKEYVKSLKDISLRVTNREQKAKR